MSSIGWSKRFFAVHGSRLFVLVGAAAASSACRPSSGGADASAQTSGSASAHAFPPTPHDACPASMIRVGSASFTTPRDGQVKLDPFCLAREEARVRDYERCLAVGACTEPDRGGDCNSGRPDRDDHPIDCIDHEQALRYCTWAGGRLPSIQEWQWVAQGMLATTLYPWGNEPPNDKLCWSGKTRRHETCAVGEFKEDDSPSRFVDLTGNVREWTRSVEGDPSQHAFAVGGGGFGETFEGYFDSRTRRASPAATRSGDLGVRCAAELGAFPFRGPTPSVSSAPLSSSAPEPTARSGPSSKAPSARPADSGLVAPNDASGVCPASTSWVRGGAFVAAGERATTRVAPLCVDVHEATVEQFAACVTAGVCREPDRGGACNWGVAARRDHPINCLSQAEAVTYCNWARARLPTVVESEWIARGGQAGTSYPWGNAVPLGQLCWSGPSPRRNTCPVGAFPDGQSKEGIADLIGNVLEWTSTPSNRGTQRFRLGGGSFADTDAAQVRWTVDWDEVGETHAPSTGVRCVTTARPLNEPSR